jgi:DUF2971 family protein
MPIRTLSPTLDRVLDTIPPSLLFHYTSAAGLIGILRERQVWASNVAFLNDSKEIDHAVDIAKLAVENSLRYAKWSSEQRDLLEEMRSYVGGAAKRYYVFSLSEERDLLSQWRAYCPPGGGYSVGFPSKQLKLMCAAQNFMLSPCVYNPTLQNAIVSEWLSGYLQQYEECRERGELEAGGRQRISWEFGQHIAQFGAFLKHQAFEEEREWRLISPLIDESHSQIDFRSSSTRIIPFFRFNLSDNANRQFPRIDDDVLTVVVGPTSDPPASQMAVQFLLTSLAKGAVSSSSSVPYRTW